MYKILKNLEGNRELTSIYTDVNNCDRFAVGYIMDVTETQALILNIGLHGEFDGYTVIKVDDIYRIETQSKYLKKINGLSDVNIDTVFEIKTTDDLLIDVLNKAIERKSIVVVGVGDIDNSIMGYVEKVEDNKVYIEQVNEYGESDGSSVILYNEIVRVVIEDVECCEIDRLYHYRDK